MNADIIHDPNFPHGTGDGFRGGCHGGHCPAPIACRDVHRRYAGDWSFRKAVDAGMTAQEIRDAEAERERAAREAERAARRTPKPKRATPAPRRVTGTTTHLQASIAVLHAEGLTDRQIGDKIGKTREQVRATRRHLNLPLNVVETTDDRIRKIHATGQTDTEIAAELGKDTAYISKRRRWLKLPRNLKKRAQHERVKELHGQGMTDLEIAAACGVTRSVIAKRRADLELAPNKPSASPGASAFPDAA